MILKKIKVAPRNAEVEEMEAPAMFPPSFRVDNKQIPEIKGLDVGGKYRFMIEVEMKSKEERKKSIDSRFDVVAYKYIPKKTLQEMSDKELELELGK